MDGFVVLMLEMLYFVFHVFCLGVVILVIGLEQE